MNPNPNPSFHSNFNLYSNPNQHINIDKIIISSPSQRTQNAYFKHEFDSIFSQPQTLHSLDANLRVIYDKLQSSGMFEVVDMNLQVHTIQENKYKGNINLYIKERGIPFLKMESYIQTGSSSSGSSGNSSHSSGNNLGFEIQGALRNPSGYGENIRLSMGGNVAGRRENSIYASFPYTFLKNYHMAITAKMTEENNSYFTSFNQKYHSLYSDILSRDNSHQLRAEITIRDEIPTSHKKIPFASDTSLPILDMICPSIKSSLTYSHSIDHRDSPILPSSGYYASGSIEIAIPPGSAQYIKSDLSFQQHIPILKSNVSNRHLFTFSYGGTIGMIQPLQRLISDIMIKIKGSEENIIPITPPQSRIFLSDRYHSGGPLALRGFSIYGIGSRANSFIAGGYEQGDSIGGLIKTNLITCLSCPLPTTWSGLRDSNAFLYLNAGSLGQGEYSSILKYFGMPRISVGSGIAINITNIARLEVTYSIPLFYAKHDITKPFQIGVGLSII